MYSRSPLVIGLIVVVLVLLAVGLAARQFVSIKSTGTPLGPAARTATHILQLVTTTENYLPKLHRAPGSDRFRIDLLAISIVDPTRQQTFTLLRQKQSNALTPVTKILGADGDVVWIQALDIFAVNLKTGRVAREADLRKANRELDVFLASAKPQFNGRFVAVSPDWSHAYEFSADTLKASACPPPPRGSGILEERAAGRIEGSLCSGGLVSAGEWIAVATPDDAKRDFRPGFSLPRAFDAGENDRKRQLHRGTADTREKRPPVLKSERVSGTEYRAANFLRAKPGGPILQTPSPDSVFLVHRVGTELFAPYTLTRLLPDGTAHWSAATGIGRLQQALPGSDVIALVGERPPVPDHVPEPILVLISTATGATTVVSLWR
jgi:hypothetical protein